MPYEIGLSDLTNIVDETHFPNRGDRNEQAYWPVFRERFPNCELYWRYLIIPGSNWILPRPEGQSGFGHRTTVSDQLLQIWHRHYSLFVQLSFAPWHIGLGAPSSFENCYTHLGSTCDLAEDFLLFNYILILECEGKQSPILQQMSKDEFLTCAAKWYDKRYSKLYENYHRKGKGSPLHLPARQDLLQEYFGNCNPGWVEYRGFSRQLREYRNVVVHDALIGAVSTPQGRLVPKKEFIGKYRFFGTISAAASDMKLLKSDFILEQEQMIADFVVLQTLLNRLWKKPIDRLRTLLYGDQNPILLSKYDLSLSY